MAFQKDFQHLIKELHSLRKWVKPSAKILGKEKNILRNQYVCVCVENLRKIGRTFAEPTYN